MKDLKPIDYKLLYELMKDSHRSDRQLAKALGVSQPTVTRRRAMLEENYIEGYTVIPKFGEIGLEIATVTLIKSKLKNQIGQERQESEKKLREWYSKQPNVICAMEIQTINGYDFCCLAFHENFFNLSSFIKSQNGELGEWILETTTFSCDLRTASVLKPFHLKYLASQK